MFVGAPSEMAGVEDVARRAGFAAVRVVDAASAEVMLSHRPADLIVLDGGQIDFGACRRLASLRVGSVLVVTGTDDEVDRVLALELGADDCVSPSCGDRELAARMRALARRAPRPADGSHVLRFLDFRLDLLKLDLRRLDGGRVPLSRSELELLHLFLSNTGRVLSPDDIRAACKGEQWLNSRNVAVRVSRLRRRLRAESGQDPIRTVHAQGYIFDTPVVPA
ncbi:response regulator transcription factor [Brevundimonas sp. Root1423]|uniref:response regulator transcription factor n=1 Tax=Brevundimonas sp. Root1423 TaxID=1736462 RepID=UPI00138F7D20|nr:winged helix-turn-helix domain-containing protein [Brevundimonas sp. Root1423]